MRPHEVIGVDWHLLLEMLMTDGTQLFAVHEGPILEVDAGATKLFPRPRRPVRHVRRVPHYRVRRNFQTF